MVLPFYPYKESRVITNKSGDITNKDGDLLLTLVLTIKTNNMFEIRKQNVGLYAAVKNSGSNAATCWDQGCALTKWIMETMLMTICFLVKRWTSHKRL